MIMQFSRLNRAVLAGAAFCAAGLLLPTASSFAALTSYQTAVNADSPYEFYRFEENPVNVGSTATDTSGNGRVGSYTVGATGGQFVPGDNAVSFNGSSQYLLVANTAGFGSLIGTSSYEFVYKTNPGFNAVTPQSLFGVFNTGTALALQIDLNTGSSGSALTNGVRFFIRDNVNDAVSVSFTNPKLYDGGYHHLVYTFNASGIGVNAFNAYVDGALQNLSFTQLNNDLVNDADGDPDSFSNFSFNPAYAARNAAGSVGQFANVTMDEAAIYPTVLTQAQVSAHAAVPEPASGALAVITGMGLLMRRRRGLR